MLGGFYTSRRGGVKRQGDRPLGGRPEQCRQIVLSRANLAPARGSVVDSARLPRTSRDPARSRRGSYRNGLMASKAVAEIRLEHGEPLTAEQLASLPIFKGTPLATFEKYPGAVVLRRFEKGDVVCREGEFGSTAFFILEGSATVSLRAPMA